MFPKLLVTFILLASMEAIAAPVASIAATAAAKASTTATSLVGTWIATGGMTGTITFSQNGKVVLAPEGFTPAEGRWKVDGSWLHIIADGRGRSVMNYSMAGDLLTLWYHQNGERQSFKRK